MLEDGFVILPVKQLLHEAQLWRTASQLMLKITSFPSRTPYGTQRGE